MGASTSGWRPCPQGASCLQGCGVAGGFFRKPNALCCLLRAEPVRLAEGPYAALLHLIVPPRRVLPFTCAEARLRT